MSEFLVPVRDQQFLLATSHRELLDDPSSVVWTIIDVVDRLDMSEVYRRYRLGGRPPFDPRMMLALLVFGYSEGRLSSRALEAACRRDLAYRAICGGLQPDHATIARFRVRLDDLMEGLFVQVLSQCAAEGLVDLGLLAVDGTKLAGAGSKEANVTVETAARDTERIRELLAVARQADLDDPHLNIDGDSDSDTGDSPFGSDTLDLDVSPDPDAGWSVLRRQRQLERDLDRAQATVQAGIDAAQRREADRQKKGRKRNGEPVANRTDPESRLQKCGDGGWVQGFNAQAVATSAQIVVCAEVVAETTDVGQFEPLLRQTTVNLKQAGVAPALGVVVADAGYCSAANIGLEPNPAADVESEEGSVSLDVGMLLIATAKNHKIGGITEIDLDDASDAQKARHLMETRLADPELRAVYRQRGPTIEGVFADTKHNRGITRFSRRGLKACAAEWKLIHIAANIRKIHSHRQTNTRPGPTAGPCRRVTVRRPHQRLRPLHARY